MGTLPKLGPPLWWPNVARSARLHLELGATLVAPRCLRSFSDKMAKWLWLGNYTVCINLLFLLGWESRVANKNTPTFFLRWLLHLDLSWLINWRIQVPLKKPTHLKDVINISIISKVTVTHFEVTVTRSFKVKVQEQPPLRYSFLVGWLNQPILKDMIVKFGSWNPHFAGWT